MAFVPRRYDPAIIEALALTGGLDPDIDTGTREAAAQKAASWMALQDPEGTWTARIAGAGRLSLNRPKAIHALNLDMVHAMTEALVAWNAERAEASASHSDS